MVLLQRNNIYLTNGGKNESRSRNFLLICHLNNNLKFLCTVYYLLKKNSNVKQTKSNIGSNIKPGRNVNRNKIQIIKLH